jgi:hypothetical protein
MDGVNLEHEYGDDVYVASAWMFELVSGHTTLAHHHRKRVIVRLRPPEEVNSCRCELAIAMSS